MALRSFGLAILVTLYSLGIACSAGADNGDSADSDNTVGATAEQLREVGIDPQIDTGELAFSPTRLYLDTVADYTRSIAVSIPQG